MGNVGLNFGSATSGAGFDVTTTVSQIVTNLQAVETPWKTSLTSLTAQDTALTSLGTQLSTLTTDLQALTDASGVLASKQGSSSDTSVLQLSTAGTNAVAGTHSVEVTNLAVTSTAATDAVKATDGLTGTITFKIGSGSLHTVTVGDSSTAATLSGLASAINRAGVGVAASVLSNADGTARLSLVSQTNGSAGQITIDSATTLADTTTADTNNGLGLKTIQTGVDATLLVDGVQLTSASNSVSTAIPGVTFQLLSANVGEQVQVVIANDEATISTAMSTFVTDYNATMKAINAQEGKDASGNPEPLYGSSLLARLQTALQTGLNAGAGSGSITSLYSLGITSNQDGTISLDTDALTTALNSNYPDVVAFFQNAGSFGGTFADTLGNLGNSHTYGAITLALSENSSQETTLNDDVASEEALIAIKKTTLTTELNLANEILQAIPSQINAINEMYSAVTGYSKNS